MDDEWYMEEIKKVDEYMQQKTIPDEIKQAYYHGVRGWISVLSARLSLQSHQYLTLTEEQITKGYKLVRQARKYLNEYKYSDTPETAAGILRDVPLMKEAGLLELVMMLESGKHNTHKNDVLGLIKHIEQLIAGNWPKQKEDR